MPAEESERSQLPFEPNKKRQNPAKVTSQPVVKPQVVEETPEKTSFYQRGDGYSGSGQPADDPKGSGILWDTDSFGDYNSSY